MNKPCKYCDKAVCKEVGTFEQECNDTCGRFNTYVDGISEKLDELLAQGNEILKKHGTKI